MITPSLLFALGITIITALLYKIFNAGLYFDLDCDYDYINDYIKDGYKIYEADYFDEDYLIEIDDPSKIDLTCEYYHKENEEKKELYILCGPVYIDEEYERKMESKTGEYLAKKEATINFNEVKDA